MRAIPRRVFYPWIKFKSKIGLFLCLLGWHDPQIYLDGKPLEHDGFCICCGKWKIHNKWTNDMKKFYSVIR